MQDERLLLSRARSLDKEALAEVHETYYDSIYRYIAFRVNDLQTVEDLTSEVFLRFLDAIRDRNAPQNTIRGWLFGVASRVVKEHYRQKKRTQHSALLDSTPSAQPGPDTRVAEAMTREELQEAITHLTEDQQQVLALRFGYEMPIRDVAETMNKSEGSVKMLQVRAISALTQRFRGSEVSQ